MKANDLKKRFIEIYGSKEGPIRIFTSPGRVNLIGEHTDYNGGYVLPAALTLSSTVAARPRKDRTINLAVTDIPGLYVNASLDGLDRYKGLKWGSYQLGVADELQKAGYALTGCDMLFHDTVPLKSGLSSSAAIEVVTALALAVLGNEASGVANQAIDKVRLAVICQTAEHNYIGVKCGIMDQFASALGKAGHAIFLDCRDLSYKYVPLNLKGYRIVLSDTKKQRSLGAVKYNERRSECEQGLASLKKGLPFIRCLGEVSPGQFEQYKHLIGNDTVRKRVCHVIYEDDRVLKSIEALQKGNIRVFGRYMAQSHDSLRDLYEVTGIELDTLVEETRKIDGVVGSRMTGAGFGGCTVSIVKETMVERFIEQAGRRYLERIGINAEFYVSIIGDGAREITAKSCNT